MPGPHLQQQSYLQLEPYVHNNLQQPVSLQQSYRTTPQDQARHNRTLPVPPQGAPPPILQQHTNGLKPQPPTSRNPYVHLSQLYKPTQHAPPINGNLYISMINYRPFIFIPGSQAQSFQNAPSLAGALGQTRSTTDSSTATNRQRKEDAFPTLYGQVRALIPPFNLQFNSVFD